MKHFILQTFSILLLCSMPLLHHAQSCTDGDNVTQNPGATVSGTTQESDNPPANIVDNNTADNSRWSVEGYPTTGVIDLQNTYSIDEVELFPYQDRSYQYTIEVSTDGNNYTQVVDRSGNTTSANSFADNFAETDARYIRLTVLDCDCSSNWSSINELKVYCAGTSSGNTIDAFSQIEAENLDGHQGLTVNSDHFGYFDDGDYAFYEDVDFGTGASSVDIHLAVDNSSAGKTIEFRTGSPTGTLIGSHEVEGTGGWSAYATQSTSVNVSGINDLYIVGSGGSGIANIDWFSFDTESSTVAVTGVSVSPTSVSLEEGQTAQLNETVSPSDATDQSVTWSSSNTSIVTVDANGLVTAVAEGSATITVTTNDGEYTATSDFSVSSASSGDGSITVRAKMRSGSSDNLELRIDDNTVKTWTVSGSSYADYTYTGLSGSGNLKIYFQDNGTDMEVDYITTGNSTYQAEDQSVNTSVWQNSSCGGSYSEIMHCPGYIDFGTINFGDGSTVAVTGVSVSPTSTSVNVGNTTQLTETVSPSDASDQSVTWSSSNTSIAKVNANGLVTAESVGTATITVTTNDGGYTATSDVSVTSSNTTCGSSSGGPTNNPIEDAYPGEYSWTSNIKWDCVYNISDYSGTDTEKFNAAVSDAHDNGGGVVYFPAGTYSFSDHLYLKSDVVLRGATPSNQDAQSSSYDPPVNFEFPAYNFSESGSGADNSTAFKFIYCENIDNANNIGMVWIDVNRAGIDFHAQDVVNATGENMVLYGVRTNNVAKPDPNVPDTSVGQKDYQRYCYRFTRNVSLYNYKNILVANTRHNDNVTDTYAYNSFIVDDNGSPYELTGGKAKFNYTDHYVLAVGHGSGSCSAGTPSTCPENFREGIDIRDNWMYHTMRVAIYAAGMGLEIKNNVIRDEEGKSHWVHPTGTKIASNNQTLENRAIDWSGYNVVVDGNDFEVFRHQLRNTSYLSIDGEGILIQECCGGSMVNGVDITNNTGNSYIGVYKMRDIDDAYIAGNDLSTGTTDVSLIYVNANTNTGQYSINNSIVENNTLAGSKSDIVFKGSGGSGSGNVIQNNVSDGGYIEFSCAANPSVSGNSGFTINSCVSGNSRMASTTESRNQIEELNNNAFNVYPNPTSGKVNLAFPQNINGNLVLINSLGSTVLEEKINDVESIDLDLSGLSSGLYYGKIYQKNETNILKIIIE